MTRIKKRRIEITASESRLVFSAGSGIICPVCLHSSELLTVRQAGLVTQVTVATVRRWLGEGLIHGVRTPGGRHRICRASLWDAQAPIRGSETQLDGRHLGDGVADQVFRNDRKLLVTCLEAAKSVLGTEKPKPIFPEEIP